MTSKKSDLERHIPHSEAGARQQAKFGHDDFQKSLDRAARAKQTDKAIEAKEKQAREQREHQTYLAETKARSVAMSAKINGEYSLEMLDKEFEQLPFRLGHEFDDFVRRENVRLQGIEIELGMKDKFANSEAQRVKSDRTHEAQVYVQTSTHDHVLAKDFETHKASLGHYGNPASQRPVLTPEQLEDVKRQTLSPAPANPPQKQLSAQTTPEEPYKEEDPLSPQEKFLKGD